VPVRLHGVSFAPEKHRTRLMEAGIVAPLPERISLSSALKCSMASSRAAAIPSRDPLPMTIPKAVPQAVPRQHPGSLQDRELFQAGRVHEFFQMLSRALEEQIPHSSQTDGGSSYRTRALWRIISASIVAT